MLFPLCADDNLIILEMIKVEFRYDEKWSRWVRGVGENKRCNIVWINSLLIALETIVVDLFIVTSIELRFDYYALIKPSIIDAQTTNYFWSPIIIISIHKQLIGA